MGRIATCSIINGNGGVEAYKKFLDHGCWCVINDHIVTLDDFCSYGETVDGKCLRETADNKDRREAAEQDAYEQLCNLGNPEDGSL